MLTTVSAEAPINNLTSQQVNLLTKNSNIKKGIKAVNKLQYDKAEKYFLKASRNQNILGDYNLGVLYGENKFKRRSETTAIKWMLKAAQQGLVYAQYDLGIKYIYGEDSIKSGTKAIYWLEVAGSNGYIKAQSSLGEAYENGRITTQSYEKAVYWYNLAKEQDNFSRVRLKHIYENGLVARPDKKSDAFWKTTAALQEYDQLNGQQLYDQAVLAVKEKDLSKMDFLFQLAADKDNGDAQIYFAKLNESKKDYQKAAQWFQKAAENGHTNAQYSLGRYYQIGQGVLQSLPQAITWYTKSAKQGNVYAMMTLADMYETGTGVKQSYSQALTLYKQATNSENSLAQFKVGYFYEKGLGMGNKARWLAKSWYLKAAQQGHQQAQNRYQLLADEEQKIYQQGFTLENNGQINSAVSLFVKSASMGHLNSQLHLGSMYYKGIKVEKDFYKASKWYQKAAEQGDANAQYKIGYMYHHGEFFKKSKFDANIWYKKAIQQEHALALNSYNTLNATAPYKKTGSWKDFHRQRNADSIREKNCRLYGYYTSTGKFGYNEGIGHLSGRFIECTK